MATVKPIVRRLQYTPGEVARICEASPNTVRKWVDAGHLRGHRLPLSGYMRVGHGALVKFMRETGIPIPAELEG